MIIKYLNDGCWGYADNLSNVVHTSFSMKDCYIEYNERKKNGEIIEPLNDYEEKVNVGNSVFTIASNRIKEELIGYDCNTINLIDYNDLFTDDYDNQVCVIIANLIKRKEYDKIIFITNQSAFLMNDEGKTIDRLA